MSLRKTQLKKMTIEEIMTRLNAETDSDNIKLINTYICQKNTVLLQKRQALIEQIETTRKKIQKNVHSLNLNIKDRIERKEKITMDKDSRPTTQDMTGLMELYTYMENQGGIMDRNIDYVQQLTGSTRTNFQTLQQALSVRVNSQHLDLQYQEFHRKCEQQEKIRNELLRQRNQKRSLYANIIKTIEDCRVEYEDVENKIRDAERELIRVATYYNARQAEDNAALVELPQQAVEYQSQLLSAQSKLNQSECSYQQRLMRQIQVKIAVSR